jgi:hypothetical protein
MKTKKRCQALITAGHWKGHQCSNTATLELHGKYYCSVHYGIAVKNLTLSPKSYKLDPQHDLVTKPYTLDPHHDLPNKDTYKLDPQHNIGEKK